MRKVEKSEETYFKGEKNNGINAWTYYVRLTACVPNILFLIFLTTL